MRSKCQKKEEDFLYESILLINLSQTAYFDGLTLSDDRKWYGDSTGLNIIFIRAIGARNIKIYSILYKML